MKGRGRVWFIHAVYHLHSFAAYRVCQDKLRLKRPQCSSAMHPKASHSVGPLSNKSRYDTISVSLLSVFCPLKKSSQHAHKIHKKNIWSLQKAVELQCQNFFQILRCGFSENWGKEISDRLRIHEANPTQFATNLHWTFLWHAWVFSHFATKETQQCAWFFSPEGLTSR